MPTPDELEKKLWKALKSDMTVMLGLSERADAHTRPMTAQIEDDSHTIWFFGAKGTDLVDAIESGSDKGHIAFESKGHDVFACIHGKMTVDNDPAVIERLWNSHVAAWYEGGKTDPKLALMKFKPNHAEIWKDGSSVVAGLKSLFGSDPKEDAKNKTAKVNL